MLSLAATFFISTAIPGLFWYQHKPHWKLLLGGYFHIVELSSSPTTSGEVCYMNGPQITISYLLQVLKNFNQDSTAQHWIGAVTKDFNDFQSSSQQYTIHH